MEYKIFFTLQYLMLRIIWIRGQSASPPADPTDSTYSSTKAVTIYNAGKEMGDIEKRIVNELSWPTKLLLLKDYTKTHYPEAENVNEAKPSSLNEKLEGSQDPVSLPGFFRKSIAPRRADSLNAKQLIIMFY